MVKREEFISRLKDAGIDTNSVDDYKDLVTGLSRTFVNVSLCYMFSCAGMSLDHSLALLQHLFMSHIKSELKESEDSEKITKILWSVFEVELIEGVNQIQTSMMDPNHVASMKVDGGYFH